MLKGAALVFCFNNSLVFIAEILRLYFTAARWHTVAIVQFQSSNPRWRAWVVSSVGEIERYSPLAR
jgi:hypothetical protein